MQLEAHVKGHQVARADHHHHADDAERDQHRIFKPQQPALFHIGFGHRQHRRRAEQHGDLGKTGKAVFDEQTVKGDARGATAGHTDPDRQQRHHDCRGPDDHPRGGVLVGVNRPKQCQDREKRQQDFGQDDIQISGNHRAVLYSEAVWTAAPAASRAVS